MIRALIFDLDGTLVQTEHLKALSYARAVVRLRLGAVREDEVLEAFKDVVGLSRQQVSEALLQRFDLREAAAARRQEFAVATPWQAFAHLRLAIYNAILAEPRTLRDHLCRYNVGLLRKSRREGYQTALATMSYAEQVAEVLRILAIKDELDFIATREDVEHGKPAAEIYNLVADQLKRQPAECLVIEDSPTGVKAALAARMHCIVVTNLYTREAIHHSNLLDSRWVVDNAADLDAVATGLIAEQANT